MIAASVACEGSHEVHARRSHLVWCNLLCSTSSVDSNGCRVVKFRALLNYTLRMRRKKKCASAAITKATMPGEDFLSHVNDADVVVAMSVDTSDNPGDINQADAVGIPEISGDISKVVNNVAQIVNVPNADPKEPSKMRDQVTHVENMANFTVPPDGDQKHNSDLGDPAPLVRHGTLGTGRCCGGRSPSLEERGDTCADASSASAVLASESTPNPPALADPVKITLTDCSVDGCCGGNGLAGLLDTYSFQCMYICMYCIYVLMCVCVCMRACMRVMHVCLCVVCMSCMRVSMCACIYFMNVCMHECVCFYACICVYMCACMDPFIYMYVCNM